jgi:hypothetical protein
MRTLTESLVNSDVLQPLLGWLAMLSILTFFLSLILIPWVVGKLRQDCFLTLQQKEKQTSHHSIGAIILAILRNILGMILLFAGILMLFLPGQGLLTILLGTLLISFPGKKRLINSLVHLPKIQHSMDWLRKKRGKPAFLWPNPKPTCKNN